MTPIEFTVDRREHGKTLASALKTRYGISWSRAKRLVEKRHVRVSGQIETDVARRLNLGKRIQIDAGSIELKRTGPKPVSPPKKEKPPLKKPTPAANPRGTSATPPPSPMPSGIEIVYSDDAVVVANKPAGLTTMRHAGEAAEFGRGKRFLPKTLADALPGLLGSPDRPVIAVHRIDRDTSGLVVFARTRAAADGLTRQFRKHTVDRRYVALTRGSPPAGRVQSVFVPDRGDGRRGSTTEPVIEEGKRAVTHVKVIESLGKFAAVECRLETGRTHQVRIHLGEAGTPLCGERVYDRPVNGRPVADDSGAERPMLHAARLGFRHPITGEELSWDAKPPADFAAVWAHLRGR